MKTCDDCAGDGGRVYFGRYIFGCKPCNGRGFVPTEEWSPYPDPPLGNPVPEAST